MSSTSTSEDHVGVRKRATVKGTKSGRNKVLRERDRRKRLTDGKQRLIVEHLKVTKQDRCAAEGLDCKGALVLDHIDNDPRNESLMNWQWLCRRHNRLKPGSFVNKPVSVRENVEGEQIAPNDNLVSLSEKMQADANRWLWEKIGPGAPHKYLSISMVEKNASYDCQISPVTMHRYIVYPGPMTASNAPFRLVWRVVLEDRPSRKRRYIMWRGNKVGPGDGVVDD